MISSVPPPMYRMPQERIHGAQQYSRLGQSGALGDLVAQPREEAVGPASRSFVARMCEAERLEQEAAELHAAAADGAGQLPCCMRELIRIWKDAWRVGPCPSVTSGVASTSTTPARPAPMPSANPAPIIATTVPNVSGTIVSILDTGLSDSLGDLSDVNWAGIRETIAQSGITASPAATSTISALAMPMDLDDAVCQHHHHQHGGQG